MNQGYIYPVSPSPPDSCLPRTFFSRFEWIQYPALLLSRSSQKVNLTGFCTYVVKEELPTYSNNIGAVFLEHDDEANLGVVRTVECLDTKCRPTHSVSVARCILIYGGLAFPSITEKQTAPRGRVKSCSRASVCGYSRV